MLRVFHHYFSSRKLTLFLAESLAVLFFGTLGAAVLARAFSAPNEPFVLRPLLPMLAMLAVGFVVSLQFALYLFDLYDLRVAQEDKSRGNRILKAGAVAAILMGLLLIALHAPLPKGAVLGAAAGALVGAAMLRAGVRAVLGDPSRVLILGDGIKAHGIAKAIADEGEDAFQVVGMVDPRRAEGRTAQALVQQHKAEYAIVAMDEARGGLQIEDLVRCRFEGCRVYEGAGFSERVLRRIPVAHLRASELAFADELTVSPVRRFLKRAFDLGVATVLLVLAAPVMALLSVIIKLDSKGPIFYRQERVGLNGKPYHLWKFRSMRTDAEANGAVWAKTNDDRVTRVGRFIRKTRMDEIPQVFNVLLGDMSFVGPRPERPVFVDQLKQQIPFYGLREGVKPGITGWAQIRYPYGASVEDARNKLEFDLYYVKNASLFLDVAIIFHTVRHVLLGRGAR
jgi:sugar transferase (PEP-CTERM system associated)